MSLSLFFFEFSAISVIVLLLISAIFCDFFHKVYVISPSDMPLRMLSDPGVYMIPYQFQTVLKPYHIHQK